MVGNSKASAPSARKRSTNSPACLRVRVTAMRLPKSESVSNQLSFSRRATTSPNTATAGGLKPVSWARSAIFSRVPARVCWAPVVAHRTRVTGVREGMPAVLSSPAIALSLSTPISMTFVPGARAIA